MTRAPRVLHIGKYFHPFAGGMENYLADLMVALANRGVAGQALVHEASLSLRGRSETVELRGAQLAISRAATWARVLFTPISPGFPMRLYRLLRARPDIVHIHMPNVSAFWLLFLPGARRARWVVHWHSDVVASPSRLGLRIFYHLYRPFERALLRRSDRIIVTSPPYLESSAALADFRDRCVVHPLGLDPARLGDAPEGAAGDPRRLRVLSVGRLTYYKGFDVLLRACALCPTVDLHIVGEGEDAPTLRRLGDELRLGDRVSFHGKLPDAELAQQYADCDVFCLPSIERTEAFGVVLLEAMHFRRPAVVSAVEGSGMGWVIEDGVSGLTVPPGDAQALAAGLQQLADDPGLCAELGARAADAFAQRFHIDRSAESILALYRELLSEAA